MHEVIAEEWNQEANDEFKWQQRWEAVMSSSFERLKHPRLLDRLLLQSGVKLFSVLIFRFNFDHRVPLAAPASLPFLGINPVEPSNLLVHVTPFAREHIVLLCRGTETIPLTVDQKPDREDELLRIEEQDGKVINWNGARVFGVLAMSRAIGDRYLRPWIIPVPEISFTTRTDEDECSIIASDGLWDVMSNNEVGELARRILRRRRRYAAAGEVTAAQTVADSLTEIAVGRNSSDNISVIVVDLKSKKKQRNT
ncbi:hypothetical protein E3N88_09554 [Mikania micrantha]|uniref:PPM-type phosphatase domain-containing protein n=1 Tax=Mikania micrantha TaxID=192012 RepID=A0A5N6PKA1_9ASTR|nr:hypothetical protein E3N88_09554 [Mikania micrantha]